MLAFHFFLLTFAHANRDVAQLVAHYVRDVGVGRSSRLIPTLGGRRVSRLPFFHIHQTVSPCHVSALPGRFSPFGVKALINAKRKEFPLQIKEKSLCLQTEMTDMYY